MVHQFDQVATELDLNGRAAALGITPYQALIVASMVEREAGHDGRRPQRRPGHLQPAGRPDEPLGIDATSCYEKNEIPCELTDGRARGQHALRHAAQAGLPPTPDRLARPRQPRRGAEPRRWRLALVRARRRGGRRVEPVHRTTTTSSWPPRIGASRPGSVADRAGRPVTGATQVAAVIGSPVRHSLSPVLLNAAFRPPASTGCSPRSRSPRGPAGPRWRPCARSAWAGCRSRCRTRRRRTRPSTSARRSPTTWAP